MALMLYLPRFQRDSWFQNCSPRSKTRTAFNCQYAEENRIGDHICYSSDLRKMKSHYSVWDTAKTSDDIFDEIASSWMARLSATS